MAVDSLAVAAEVVEAEVAVVAVVVEVVLAVVVEVEEVVGQRLAKPA